MHCIVSRRALHTPRVTRVDILTHLACVCSFLSALECQLIAEAAAAATAADFTEVRRLLRGALGVVSFVAAKDRTKFEFMI